MQPTPRPEPEPPILAAAETRLGDFSMGLESLRLIPLALLVGAIATAIALVLLDLIGLVTNLLYGGRIDTALVSPVTFSPGPAAVLIPVAGGLVIGLIARFGSSQIRGHGIPEAMETILTGGSRVQPRLAVLKPIASAISIVTSGKSTIRRHSGFLPEIVAAPSMCLLSGSAAVEPNSRRAASA